VCLLSSSHICFIEYLRRNKIQEYSAIINVLQQEITLQDDNLHVKSILKSMSSHRRAFFLMTNKKNDHHKLENIKNM